MNEVQRQLLADRLDDIGRRLDSYQTAIAKLEKQLANKRAVVDALRKEKEELEKGVDW